MRRTFLNGMATVYLGDARDLVKRWRLPRNGKVIATDAPYKVSSGGAGSRNQFGGFMREYVNDGELVSCSITWPEIVDVCDRLAADQSDLYIMSNAEHMPELRTEAKAAGLRYHNTLIWNKPSAMPNRWYMENFEMAAYLYKGSARAINNCGSRALFKLPVRKATKHPTEKPVALMRAWIMNSSDPGDLIIDPFMGSGTTAVAALQCGRRFIGIELEDEWFDVACTRITTTKVDARYAVTSKRHQQPQGTMFDD